VLWYRGGRKQLLERIEALEKALESYESRVRLITIEWESVLHKVNGVMGRLNARIRKNEAQETPEEAPHDSGPSSPRLGSHATLMHMRGKHGLLPR